ncbi:Ig-like domain-containing protein [Microbacterium sp.]|uniref:Ig-like domain-containing protein n=1 Tax=Microbacterium sp. TaxID=51671 RepID=UPI003F703DBE
MTLKTTLGRGLAALGTIGALGLGSLLAAAPANAAEPENRAIIYVQPGETVTAYPTVKGTGITVQPGMTAYAFADGPGATIIKGAPYAGFIQSGSDWNRVTGLNISQCGTWSVASQRFDCKATTSTNYVTATSNTYRWEVQLVIPANAQPGDEFRARTAINTMSFQGISDTYVVAEPEVEIADLVVTSPAVGSTIDTEGVVFQGTAEPSATVVITDADGAVLGEAVADAQGSWSATVAGPLAEGPLDLTFTAGEKVVEASYVVVIDEEGEGVPVMPLAAGLGAGALALAGLGAFGIRRRFSDKA